MSISSVSSSSAFQPSQISDVFKQRKQDFTALANALQSGDLAGAQKAFAAMQQDSQAISQAQGGQAGAGNAVQAGPSSQSGATSMGDLMNQLKQALSSGDLQGAQQAFASIQQSKGHGHHHHHGGGSQPSAASTVSMSNSSSSPSATTSVNTTA